MIMYIQKVVLDGALNGAFVSRSLLDLANGY
jgi:hypothetical protein